MIEKKQHHVLVLQRKGLIKMLLDPQNFQSRRTSLKWTNFNLNSILTPKPFFSHPTVRVPFSLCSYPSPRPSLGRSTSLVRLLTTYVLFGRRSKSMTYCSSHSALCRISTHPTLLLLLECLTQKLIWIMYVFCARVFFTPII